MGKTRDLFKIIRDTKGKINLGTINDRNCLDLNVAEDIKKWQEYTENIYKNNHSDPDNHDGVITNLQPLQRKYGRGFSSF